MSRVRSKSGGSSAGSSVAYAPAPTGVAATDYANLLAANTAAVAAGGGRILLRAGTYALGGNSLPVSAGVRWEGVAPSLRQTVVTTGTYLADGLWNYESGTVLQGNGTAPAFKANETDVVTISTSLGNTEIPGFYASGIGFDGFTYGILVGANNIMGITHGMLDKLFFKNCGWGLYLVNFAHMTFGDLRAAGCSVGGFYFGAKLPITTFQPGNSRFGELYVYTPPATNFARGIQFDARGDGGSGGSLAHLNGERLQVNRYGSSLTSVTATLTSGSTAVAVPDGTLFRVGMPVQFTTTGAGFTNPRIYMVQSVSGNNLTLGTSNFSTPVTASASTTLTLTTRGFASIEFTTATANDTHAAHQFLNLDTEGGASAALYVERGALMWLGIGVRTSTTFMDVVFRSTTQTTVQSRDTVKTDFDSGSTNSMFFGARGATAQYPLRGLWQDSVRGTNVLSVGNGYSSTGFNIGDLEARGQGFLYPFFGVGERYEGVNGASTLDGTRIGSIIFSSSSTATHTLPTITTDATPSGTICGAWFEFINVGSANLTVVTDGTQLFNKVAAKTSLTVAPQQSLKVKAVKDSLGSLFWVAGPVVTLS